MPVTISLESIVLVGALIGAIGVIWRTITKVVKKLDYDRLQDQRILEIEEQHAQDVAALRRHHDEDMAATRQEMAIICRGILASLKDDEESKKSSIKEMEDYLNRAAHPS